MKKSKDASQEDKDLNYKRIVKEQSNKIDDLQKTQSTLRTQAAKNKHPTSSIANLSLLLLGDLVDDCIYDVLFDVHRDVKQAYAVCQICQTKCRIHSQIPGHDIYNNVYNSGNLPSFECVNCQKMIASVRYASHLEKCLGLAGRQSSRVASRRMGSSPSSSDYNSDSNDNERKRKKLPSSPLTSGSRSKRSRNYDD
ncbi:hypothetical protein DM01DRAFT_1332702 [Hesseltinella vesiculosa]|uniref:SAGA-associated factor 11 n=1 Tax=Hesseltinella vesiculosa TaxID=101127 RepID=A0A1X2GSW8_9FUNG|nr:hypothetical protein DM01DRAFT_1332702 [Hesseltinella vesiculosa]